jgi:hypothetical protein
MDVVELGGIRLHLLTAYPGLPGEADRVVQALRRLGPAVILADMDTDDALRVRAALAAKKPFQPGFVDALFCAQAQRRFAPDAKRVEHPLAAAARYARDRHADLIPMRAIAPKPGFFLRRRARKIADAIARADVDAFPQAFERAMREASVWSPDAEIEAVRKRMMRVLAEGRAPVIAILQPHRRDAFEEAVLATGRIHA